MVIIMDTTAGTTKAITTATITVYIRAVAQDTERVTLPDIPITPTLTMFIRAGLPGWFIPAQRQPLMVRVQDRVPHVPHVPPTVNLLPATEKTMYTLTRAAMYTERKEIAGKAGKKDPGKKVICLSGADRPASLPLLTGHLIQEPVLRHKAGRAVQVHPRNVPRLQALQALPAPLHGLGHKAREVLIRATRNAAHQVAPGRI